MSLSQLKRVVLITLDGVGVGALPDADQFGDTEANTLLHVAQSCGGLELPNLEKLGLGNILPLPGVAPCPMARAAWGCMQERSIGKDTTTGHWELTGVIQNEPLPTYPQGFPEEIIQAFERETGLSPLGNRTASGTDIIRELGEEHLRSGRPIVYTSVDSVFQIAAHEEVIPLERLYEICRIARTILNPYKVGRVIARPFLGSCAEDFQRTPRRHDFSLPPTSPTVLDLLVDAGLSVFGVGKIRDIFAGQGITDYSFSQSNADGMAKTLSALDQVQRGVVFTNLVDFDMLFGHRLDAAGFGEALEEFDRWLPQLLDSLAPEDLLMLTADHGCDPTTAGTDHSREHVPLLAWHRHQKPGVDLGVRDSFADVATTVAEWFGLEYSVGASFCSQLLHR